METTTKEWRVYKPKKTNDGAASKLQMRVEEQEKETSKGNIFIRRNLLVFWVSAKQTGTDENGNASFGWSEEGLNVNIKLGEPDIGEILAVLNDKKTVTGAVEGKYKGIFHKHPNGNSSFMLEKNENGRGYNLRVSSKKDKEDAVQVSHQLTFGEGQILKTLMEEIVKKIYF